MMVTMLQLWMPILVGALLAWIASALIHVVVKHHNSDYRKLPNEDEVSAAIRKGSPGAGLYVMPFCVDMSDMKDKAMQQKYADGPVAFLTVFPNGMPNMGKLMAQQISFFVLGCLLIGYCASLTLAPGTEYLTVFRVVSTVGFLTFGWAVIPFSIWYGHPWSTTAKYLLDALIYGLVVAGTFAWLWP
jgi:hypothetical protein